MALQGRPCSSCALACRVRGAQGGRGHWARCLGHRGAFKASSRGWSPRLPQRDTARVRNTQSLSRLGHWPVPAGCARGRGAPSQRPGAQTGYPLGRPAQGSSLRCSSRGARGRTLPSVGITRVQSAGERRQRQFRNAAETQGERVGRGPRGRALVVFSETITMRSTWGCQASSWTGPQSPASRSLCCGQRRVPRTRPCLRVGCPHGSVRRDRCPDGSSSGRVRVPSKDWGCCSPDAVVALP